MDAIMVNPAGTDRIDVPAARIGLIIPSVNRLSEPQFTHFAPIGLGVHVTRARIAGKWRKPIAELIRLVGRRHRRRDRREPVGARRTGSSSAFDLRRVRGLSQVTSRWSQAVHRQHRQHHRHFDE